MADTPIDAALRPASHRVERRCDLCGQFDDHPHVIHPLRVGGFIDAHHDCCIEAGCPVSDNPEMGEKSCSTVLVEINGVGKTGNALLKLIKKGT